MESSKAREVLNLREDKVISDKNRVTATFQRFVAKAQ
jgi:hypothetical protein